MTNRNSKTHCLVDANQQRPKSTMSKRRNKAKAQAEGRMNWVNPLHKMAA
jgi:hypothetical protein